MKADNPFTITFGKKPAEYISRYENQETIVSTFSGNNPVSQTYLIEGIRGCGKTVLMTSISEELAQSDEWVVVDLISTSDLMNELAIRLTELCHKFPDPVKMGFGISIAGFGFSINGQSDTLSSSGVVRECLEIIVKAGKKLLITIDEVLHDKNMRVFASEFQLLIRKNYPVFLLMTGLYENIYSIQNDPALTFLLRSPKICIQPLSIYRIKTQYKKIFKLDDKTAGRLAETTKGYAFAFQALGVLYYEHGEVWDFDRIIDELSGMLDDFVYKKIWEGLSDNEQKIMRVITDNSCRVKDICDSLEMSSQTFSKYRDRLIKKGVIVSTSHGFVSSALPMFHVISQSYMINS